MAVSSQLATREEMLDSLDAEMVRLTEETEATAFGLECARREAEDERRSLLFHRTAEGLEVATSVCAGSLSTVHLGSVPAGAAANFLIGGASKVLSFMAPKHPAAQVLSRGGKEFLHCQLAILARNAILDP
ncbi:hypothetical protein G6O69_37985 [Pseudenhygromyxa sp. WMMC2535]|uniref:hypothetical protein n=1 Tax=Pseudenhygromyxa sp. WMMC2535 TaxID=2712867 RepID=UPI0015538BF2|nr:hypothetical protein [Pseudenhygromyxa sp. WMMC2535]NVB37239.1 hypothetical protein [Pseudenhygromyxa sp. WMMC2535]NVB38213.1 hypothetical protein [Pseudenhygromyxa sp. WMMC2535]NVB41612.1 hypothetical protein [Pseudenhygromyxa sp. WMMC2535]NVB43449.1 hypothetical protein [Pseudenhygromyxa sp. WMMC2535]NVB43636.1 hypothetical protein [Pseudenhygromyxa sp. WMMC2535]